MIETRINSETGNTEAVTPQRITTTMIIDDTINPNQLDIEDQIEEETNSTSFDPRDVYHEDKMHDAKVDHAQIKSDPAHMNEEELTEYDQEDEDDDNNEWN